MTTDQDEFWRHINSMKTDVRQLMDRMTVGRLPSTDIGFPVFNSMFKVDVREDDSNVIVTADLPGTTKDSLTLLITTPRTMIIRCSRNDLKETEKEGYFLRERKYGVSERAIHLPSDITDKNAIATLKNGVLEVTLKKIAKSTIPQITIGE